MLARALYKDMSEHKVKLKWESAVALSFRIKSTRAIILGVLTAAIR